MSEQGGSSKEWVVLIGVAMAILIAVGAVSLRPAQQSSSEQHPFRYDMESLRKIDPALITYAQEKRIETGFATAGGLALRPDGSLLVAGDSTVLMFGPDGKQSGKIAASGPVRCVAVSEDGTIYAGLQDHVEVYDGKGALNATWEKLGQGTRITGLAATAEDVFIADSGHRIILRCDLKGKLKNKIGARDEAKDIPGIILPSPYLKVAAGPDGLVYVNDTGRFRIEAYTTAGDLEKHWGKASMGVEGFCGCCNPIAFALHGGGGFITSEKGVARVKALDADGNLQAVVAPSESFGEDAFGIDVAVDKDGRVYVLDTGTRAVLVFGKKKEGGNARQ